MNIKHPGIVTLSYDFNNYQELQIYYKLFTNLQKISWTCEWNYM